MLNSRHLLREQLLAPEANVLPSAADTRFKSVGARNPNDSEIMVSPFMESSLQCGRLTSHPTSSAADQTLESHHQGL